jgi:hypothetical protein
LLKNIKIVKELKAGWDNAAAPRSGALIQSMFSQHCPKKHDSGLILLLLRPWSRQKRLSKARAWDSEGAGTGKLPCLTRNNKIFITDRLPWQLVQTTRKRARRRSGFRPRIYCA